MLLRVSLTSDAEEEKQTFIHGEVSSALAALQWYHGTIKSQEHEELGLPVPKSPRWFSRAVNFPGLHLVSLNTRWNATFLCAAPVQILYLQGQGPKEYLTLCFIANVLVPAQIWGILLFQTFWVFTTKGNGLPSFWHSHSYPPILSRNESFILQFPEKISYLHASFFISQQCVSLEKCLGKTLRCGYGGFLKSKEKSAKFEERSKSGILWTWLRWILRMKSLEQK